MNINSILPESLLWQVLLGVGVIAVIHAAITLGAKWWVYLQVKEMHEAGQEAISEFWAGFDSLKSWVMSARSASKDAEHAVKNAIANESSKTEVLKQVEDICDKTATKVIEKLQVDNGELPLPQSGYPRPPSGKASEL